MPMQRMTDAKMLAQRHQLRTLAGYQGMTLLHGTELSIDPDGDADWDADFLAGFDLCVASIHSHFKQSSEAIIRRLVRACENPYVIIIGHPTTRLLAKRPRSTPTSRRSSRPPPAPAPPWKSTASPTGSTLATNSSCEPSATA